MRAQGGPCTLHPKIKCEIEETGLGLGFRA